MLEQDDGAFAASVSVSLQIAEAASFSSAIARM